MPDLRYPIGPFTIPDNTSEEKRRQWINDIAEAPEKLAEAVKDLDDQQLDTPYRPGGWTVRQVVHHVADSHLNAYIRFKWGLTEHESRIKTYDEKKWAELDDARLAPIEMSLSLLKALHERWLQVLKNINGSQFERIIDHPEMGRLPLSVYLAQYSWHSKHHVAHIAQLRMREKW